MSIFGKSQRNPDNQQNDTAASQTRPRSAADGEGRAERADAPAPPASRKGAVEMANIGKSISIKGDLTGNEDLVIEGSVDGKVDLPTNELTIGENGKVRADVHAKSVVVVGTVSGNVSAEERIEIQAAGLVEGDVRAPRLVIQEGARLNGSVEMVEGKAGPAKIAPSTEASSDAA